MAKDDQGNDVGNNLEEESGDVSQNIRAIGAISLPNPDEAKRINNLELLKNLFTRFRTKKKVYSEAASLFHELDMFIFFLPLLLLEVINIVLLQLVSESSDLKVLSSTVSSLAALWLSLQMKFKWGERKQKYEAAARQYALLTAETYYRLAVVRSGGNIEDIVEFWDLARKMEREAKGASPPVPSWVARKYEDVSEPTADVTPSDSQDNTQTEIRSEPLAQELQEVAG